MKCTRCDGSRRVFIETGVVQGPKVEVHYETCRICPRCNGTGEIPAPDENMNQTQFDLARIAVAQDL